MNKGKKAAMYIFLVIISLFSVFPLYYMACAATNKSVDVSRGRLIPGTYLLENYQTLIANQDLYRALWNSFRNAAVLTFLCLLICSLAGYGFEIYHDKAKDVVFTILLTAMMVPFAAIMIPMFRMFSRMGLVNTMTAFMLPSISTPFMIMMFRQASRSFPHDIIEAARIDGLGEVGIFFRMFVPTMKSTYSAALIITFMNAWNNYMSAEDHPADQQIDHHADAGIQSVKRIHSRLWYADAGRIDSVPIPTAIIFFFFQKSFTEGIHTAQSNKKHTGG